MKQTRIFIADDHAVLRKGLKSLFSALPEYLIVGEAENGLKAVEGARKTAPDIIIMDVSMPELDGIEAARRILREAPSAKVIMLSMHQSRFYAAEALQAGASGYVLKGSETDEIVSAVKAVSSGARYLSPPVANDLLDDYVGKRGSGPADPFATLSDREVEVLRLIVNGKKNKDAATSLSISASTVKKHRQNIMKKLGVHDMAGLIKIAVKKGLLRDAD